MQTKIVIVRHGDAVGADLAGQDWDRWLSPRGRRDASSTAQKLFAASLALGPILSSPLVRAVQTAEILASARGEDAQEIQIIRSLAADEGSVAEVRATLNDMNAEAIVTVVGHMPFLQELGANLCNDADFPSLHTAHAYVVERLITRWNLVQTVAP